MILSVESFAGSVPLAIAIILGLIAATITYINSKKLSGEIFEAPFVYLATGMAFVVISLVSVTFLQGTFSGMIVGLIHDICFIVGFGLMLTASIKLTRYLSGLEGFEDKIPKKK